MKPELQKKLKNPAIIIKKKLFSRSFLAFLVIFNLTFFQLALPFSVYQSSKNAFLIASSEEESSLSIKEAEENQDQDEEKEGGEPSEEKNNKETETDEDAGNEEIDKEDSNEDEDETQPTTENKSKDEEEAIEENNSDNPDVNEESAEEKNTNTEEEQNISSSENEEATEESLTEEETATINSEDVNNTDATENTDNSTETNQEQQNDEEETSTCENPEEGDCNSGDTEKSETQIAIENENGVEAVNETESSSNTGENQISNETKEEDKEISDENQIDSSESADSASEKSSLEEPLEEENQSELENLSSEENLDENQPDLQENTNEEENLNQESEEADTAEDQKIETGDAIAQSDIFNEVNVNIVGENWEEVVINLYNNHQEDIDLLGIIDKIIENEYLTQSQIDTIITNENNADLENNASADANSGENEIDKKEGGGEIKTGNSAATANIVNIVNKNIVGNNWVFAVINVFGKWEGDLIVPGEDLIKFQNMLLQKDLEVVNKNEADIQNLSIAAANTGENSAENLNEANILTGDAYTQADSFNQVNTNIIENGWFQLTINNLGNWIGSIQDWNWKESGSASEEAGLKFEYEIDSEDTTKSENKLKVANTNNADIKNTATANSNTGKNSIKSESGDSGQITTGDASSFTNIANLVNLNIIGNNWIYTIINIMGSWSGNVIFAYPDLAINITDNKNSISPTEKSKYTVTYFNHGKAKAKDVSILITLPEDVVPATADSRNYSLALSELPANSGASFELPVSVKKQAEINTQSLLATAKIETATTEKKLGNNSGSDQTNLLFKQLSEDENNNNATNETADPAEKQPEQKNVALQDFSSELKLEELEPELEVDREVKSSSDLNQGEIITHEIIIENKGDTPVYDVKLKDEMEQLLDKKIEVIQYEWEIGYIDVDEALMIEYQVLINETAQPGNYEFKALAKGVDGTGDEVKSNKAGIPITINPALIQTAQIISEDNESKPPFEIINKAQASQENPFVRGDLDENISNQLPLWIWISALISYSLAINWAVFPRLGAVSGSIKNFSDARFFFTTNIATAVLLLFWYFASYGENMQDTLWVPLAGMFILLMHIYYYLYPFNKKINTAALKRN